MDPFIIKHNRNMNMKVDWVVHYKWSRIQSIDIDLQEYCHENLFRCEGQDNLDATFRVQEMRMMLASLSSLLGRKWMNELNKNIPSLLKVDNTTALGKESKSLLKTFGGVFEMLWTLSDIKVHTECRENTWSVFHKV